MILSRPAKSAIRLPALIAGIGLVGCAPVVRTHILQSYPPSTPADSVVVFAPNDPVPESAEVLGDLSVSDSGFTTECSYDAVIGLAQKKTSETGGNAFALTEHKPPSTLGSSCHRIKGYMLRCDDPYYYELPFTVSLAREQLASTDTPQAKTPVPASADSLPTHTLFFHAGFSGITSKFVTPPGTTKNGKIGWGFSAGYRWLSKKGIGAGILYAGHRSRMSVMGIDDAISIHYVAPEVVVAHRYGKWILTGTIGIGYACYREKADFGALYDPSLKDTYTRNGLGSHFTGSFEYLVSEYCGIGAAIGGFSCRYSKIEDLEEYDSSGLYRLTLSAGVNIHF